MPLTRSEREAALASLREGDIVFGVTLGGQQKLLLVTATTEAGFVARSMTSQSRGEFGRDGRSTWSEWDSTCVIVSAAPLPAGMQETARGLDQKVRSAAKPADLRLSEAEIGLLLEIDAFYLARALPEA